MVFLIKLQAVPVQDWVTEWPLNVLLSSTTKMPRNYNKDIFKSAKEHNKKKLKPSMSEYSHTFYRCVLIP